MWSCKATRTALTSLLDRDNRRHEHVLTHLHTTHNSGTGKKRLTHRYHHERRINHPLLASLSERYNVDVWVSQTGVVCLPLFLMEVLCCDQIQLCGPPRFQLSCANVVVLVYDITDRSSFDNICVWPGKIREYTFSHTHTHTLGRVSITRHSDTRQKVRVWCWWATRPTWTRPDAL